MTYEDVTLLLSLLIETASKAENNSTLILMGDLSACGTHRQAGADQVKLTV